MTAPQNTAGSNESDDAGALAQQDGEARSERQATPAANDSLAGSEQSDTARPESPEYQLSQSQRQVGALTGALQRERADFLNYRKRVAQEREELAERVRASAFHALLPALDDLERALQQTPSAESTEPWVEGFRLVGRKLRALLEQAGLVRIGAVGEPFDPRLHEALAAQAPDIPAEKPGTIKEVVRPGYRLGDQVVRPAQVIVVGEETSSRDQGNRGGSGQ